MNICYFHLFFVNNLLFSIFNLYFFRTFDPENYNHIA